MIKDYGDRALLIECCSTAEVLALAVGRSRSLLADRLSPEVVDAVADGRLSSFAAADGLLPQP